MYRKRVVYYTQNHDWPSRLNDGEFISQWFCYVCQFNPLDSDVNDSIKAWRILWKNFTVSCSTWLLSWTVGFQQTTSARLLSYIVHLFNAIGWTWVPFGRAILASFSEWRTIPELLVQLVHHLEEWSCRVRFPSLQVISSHLTVGNRDRELVLEMENILGFNLFTHCFRF